MAISSYFILDYHRLLMVIVGYWWLLMAISDYSINGYWCLLMVILLVPTIL